MKKYVWQTLQVLFQCCFMMFDTKTIQKSTFQNSNLLNQLNLWGFFQRLKNDDIWKPRWKNKSSKAVIFKMKLFEVRDELCTRCFKSDPFDSLFGFHLTFKMVHLTILKRAQRIANIWSYDSRICKVVGQTIWRWQNLPPRWLRPWTYLEGREKQEATDVPEHGPGDFFQNKKWACSHNMNEYSVKGNYSL